MAQLRAPTPNGRRLRQGRANAGVEAAYRNKLQRLIKVMHHDVITGITAAYLTARPQITTDASPFADLVTMLTTLRGKWLRIFNNHAQDWAESFVIENSQDTQDDLRRRLKNAGFVIRFKPDQATQRRIKLAVEENVSLIKSIPEQYHTQVRSLTTQSVMDGGDVGALKTQLQERCGVTERRAAMIARDQNHKVSVGIERQKCEALGLTWARWKHAGAGRHPRPDHLKASQDRLVFDIRQGAEIGGKRIWPGSEPNCHCRAEYIIPGYNDEVLPQKPTFHELLQLKKPSDYDFYQCPQEPNAATSHLPG